MSDPHGGDRESFESQEKEAAPAASPRAPQATRGSSRPNSIFADPVVRRLAWAGALMLVAFLATVVSALFFGVLNPPAPRTALERDLAIAQARVESTESTATVEDWYTYTNALVSSRQYAKAERMLEAALVSGFEDPTKQYLGVVRTRLAIAREDYETALKESETAMKALEAQLALEKKTYEETKQPTVMIAEGLGENYETLQLLRAEAFEALERYDDAIAELDAYLEENTRAADILVWRGDLKVANGDSAGAIEDYQAASVYMPGDEGLAEKLADLGASND